MITKVLISKNDIDDTNKKNLIYLTKIDDKIVSEYGTWNLNNNLFYSICSIMNKIININPFNTDYFNFILLDNIYTYLDKKEISDVLNDDKIFSEKIKYLCKGNIATTSCIDFITGNKEHWIRAYNSVEMNLLDIIRSDPDAFEIYFGKKEDVFVNYFKPVRNQIFISKILEREQHETNYSLYNYTVSSLDMFEFNWIYKLFFHTYLSYWYCYNGKYRCKCIDVANKLLNLSKQNKYLEDAITIMFEKWENNFSYLNPYSNIKYIDDYNDYDSDDINTQFIINSEQNAQNAQNVHISRKFCISNPKIINTDPYFPCKIYCINLERCKNRREIMIRRFNHFNLMPYVTFVKAVDKKSELAKYYGNNIIDDDPVLRAGKNACFASHIKSIRIMLEEISIDEKGGIICEDDIMLHKNFINKFNDVYKNLPDITNYFCIGYTCYDIDLNWCGKDIEKHNLYSMPKAQNWRQKTYGALMYWISKDMAKKYIKECDKELTQFKNTGTTTSELLFDFYSPRLHTWPPLVNVDTDLGTEIGGEHYLNDIKKIYSKYDINDYLK